MMDEFLIVTDEKNNELKISYSDIKNIEQRISLSTIETGGMVMSSGGSLESVEITTSDNFFSIPRIKNNDSEILTFLLKQKLFQTLKNLKNIETK